MEEIISESTKAIVRDSQGKFVKGNKDVRRQMVVDKFDKKLRNTFYSLRSFIYHFSHNSQSTILCPS